MKHEFNHKIKVLHFQH